jgi:hypothetical protein
VNIAGTLETTGSDMDVATNPGIAPCCWISSRKPENTNCHHNLKKVK